MTDKKHSQPGIKQPGLWSGILLRDLGPWLPELLSVTFFINVLALATPLFVLQVYDRVVFKASISTLQGLLLGMAIVVVFDFILKISRVRFFQSIAVKNDILLSEKIFTRIFNLPLRNMEEKALWHWQSLFHDAQLIRNVLSGAPATLLIDLPFAFLFLLVIMMIAAPLWWIFVVAMVFFILMAIFSQVIVNYQAKKEHKHSTEKDTLLADLLKHRESVGMMALQDYCKSHWINKQQQTIESSLQRGKAIDFFRTLSQSMTMILTITITSYGALAILEQQMTIGTLIAANMLGLRLIQPFVQLVEQWKAIMQSSQALKRLNEFMDLPQIKTASVTEIPVGQGLISFKDLSFSYSIQGNPAIDGLSGNIGPNGLHILMGNNGSGKSSLLKLLAGLYQPNEGITKIDGADICQFTPEQLHQKIAYLPQRIEMFQTSIFENIQIGCLSSSKEQIIDMAIKTGLHQHIIALPDGYDTLITDDNRGLSGGLIQRIAICRVLLGQPQIILLDEPHNNLDQFGELGLLSLLKELSRDHTILISSHSQNFLSRADSIVILEAGKVAIAGPAQAVINHLNEANKDKTK